MLGIEGQIRDRYEMRRKENTVKTNWITKSVSTCVMCAFVVSVISCGTIFYPERKGQKSGRIDATVAILDGVGLLFFFVPGVIAFAVDFNNGTIYVPENERRHSRLTDKSDLRGMVAVTVDKEDLTLKRIEEIVASHCGQHVDLTTAEVTVCRNYRVERTSK
jgi:hypothetical protein